MISHHLAPLNVGQGQQTPAVLWLLLVADSPGHTDSRWRRRYCALKCSQLFILRTAAASKPLLALNLSGAQITASKSPLYREGSSDSGSEQQNNSSSGVLWVLKLVLTEDLDSQTRSHSSRHAKYKLAAPSQDLQVCTHVCGCSSTSL